MKFTITSKIIFLFVFLFSSIHAEGLPEYEILDLGTLETDNSRPIAINDRGQILGIFESGGENYVFLWEMGEGLKILDMPGPQFLNNNGQLAGTVYLENHPGWKEGFGFIWSPDIGMLNIGSLGGQGAEIIDFNDKCQVVGTSNVNVSNKYESHAFFWEHGVMTDLTILFKQQVSGNWFHVRPTSLNNLGHVIIIAHNKKASESKSFIWMNGQFTMLFPEKSPSTNLIVEEIDDNGNMLVLINHVLYFYVASENKLYFVVENPFEIRSGIRNSVLISRDTLPFKLKKDLKGNEYFSPGARIHDLLIPTPPFCRYSEEIRGQNSKGWVIGYAYTLYGCGCHAFLAIPKGSNL